jgi:small neutral amino acid transporter SnatA (MarC family)
MRGLLLAFVPLFVAIDVVGLLPIYLGLTAISTTRSAARSRSTRR